MRKRHFVPVILPLAAVFICMFILPGMEAVAQEKPAQGEVNAEVPALDDFHTVIVKIWHDAWPAKNIRMLAELLPDVEKGCAAVVNAELPGILRDKKTVWDTNVGELKAIVAEYRKAAAPADSVKLLDAAERLHSQYEKLVRTIRPVLPELEDYHTTLYRLYHYELPNNDTAAIAVSVKELVVKMDALNKASLPKRFEKKGPAFESARKALSNSLDALNKAMPGKKMKDIRKKIQAMHSRYQALEKVFG